MVLVVIGYRRPSIGWRTGPLMIAVWSSVAIYQAGACRAGYLIFDVRRLSTHRHDNATAAILAAVGHNFILLLTWMGPLLAYVLLALFSSVQAKVA